MSTCQRICNLFDGNVFIIGEEDEEKSYFDIVMCVNCYGVGRNGNCELYI